MSIPDQDTYIPTDREIRMRFILLAILDAAEERGVSMEPIELTRQYLRAFVSEERLQYSITAFLTAKEMQGFRFPTGSQAEALIKALAVEGVAGRSSEPR